MKFTEPTLYYYRHNKCSMHSKRNGEIQWNIIKQWQQYRRYDLRCKLLWTVLSNLRRKPRNEEIRIYKIFMFMRTWSQYFNGETQ